MSGRKIAMGTAGCIVVASALLLGSCSQQSSEPAEEEAKPLYLDTKTGDTTGMPADYQKMMKPVDPGQTTTPTP